MAVFGCQTLLVVADLVARSVSMMSLDTGAKNEMKQILPQTSIFSPANLKSAQDLPGYLSLVDSWLRRRLTLRYSGGLVPDIFHILQKSHGIFCSPISEAAPAPIIIMPDGPGPGPAAVQHHLDPGPVDQAPKLAAEAKPAGAPGPGPSPDA